MFSENEAIPSNIRIRRESTFLIMAGLFLGSLTMLNILGVTKIIDASFYLGGVKIPFKLTVGVLAYPITFLCTDFISELFGHRRANLVVWVGLVLNFWVLFVVSLGGWLPTSEQFPDDHVFQRIRELTTSTVIASMIAYMAAQFCDVHVFHFFKRLTNGKHLWIRNNASTMVSQLIDSVLVISIAHFGSDAFRIKDTTDDHWVTYAEIGMITTLILSGYVFKLIVAIVDTIPFVLGTKFFADFLKIDPNSTDHH